jgi:hypothetical protein
MAHTVKSVNAESHASDHSRRHIYSVDGSQANHILRRSSQAYFVTPQKNVGAAIDQYYRVHIQLLRQIMVRVTNWRDSNTLEGVDADPFAEHS